MSNPTNTIDLRSPAALDAEIWAVYFGGMPSEEAKRAADAFVAQGLGSVIDWVAEHVADCNAYWAEQDFDAYHVAPITCVSRIARMLAS